MSWKLCIGLGGLACQFLVACSMPPSILVINDSGQDLMVVAPPRSGWFANIHIRPGGEKRVVEGYILTDATVQVGGCRVQYTPPELPHRVYRQDAPDTLALRVDPDLSIHLLSRPESGASPDFWVERPVDGFPVRPASKVCD